MGRASRAKQARREARLLWHFTSSHHLPSILREGVLRVTESNVSITEDHAGPDVVWLLDQPVADAPHGLDGGALDKREVRFEVRTQAVRWTDWIKTQPIEQVWLAALLRAGGGIEAARHWYIALDPIPESQWESVAIRQNDGSYLDYRKGTS